MITGMPDENEWEQDARRQRLEILDAFVLALERRTDVFEVIAASESAEVAHRRLMELLNVSEIAAIAVLDLQARRFAKLEASRIRRERDDMREHVD